MRKGAVNKLPCISSDSHIVEPAHLYEGLVERFGEGAPRILPDPEGKRGPFMVVGSKRMPIGRFGSSDEGASTEAFLASDDPGFFQSNSAEILDMLAKAPQVALVINGHTHSPLQAQGLVALLNAGDHTVPQFNAMALPFVRRLMKTGPYGGQELMTWELGIADHSLLLRGRDHLTRRLAARVSVPLSTALSLPSQPQMVQPTQGIWV